MLAAAAGGAPGQARAPCDAPKLGVRRRHVLKQGAVDDAQHSEHRALRVEVCHARAAPRVVVLRARVAHVARAGCGDRPPGGGRQEAAAARGRGH